MHLLGDGQLSCAVIYWGAASTAVQIVCALCCLFRDIKNFALAAQKLL
jgi:hypothetical protein